MTQFVGIDVSARSLSVALEPGTTKKYVNAAKGHQALVARLRPGTRVCMEATGNYGLDLAIALHRAQNVDVMVVNPRAARHFSEALMRRSKTDPVDAQTLREFAQRMEFKPWQPPRSAVLELRALSRRMSTLNRQLTEEKNRLHASESTGALALIRQDIKVNIRHLMRRIERLQQQALERLHQDEELKQRSALLKSIRGIAEVSALRILGELAILPHDMSARQWVAHAGLDPRHVESGAFKGKTRISKAGNRHLRSALYMPALVAIRYEPHVKAFRDQLVNRGKTKQQAVVAVMRKLLHSIHGMLRHGEPFDGSKFYRLPA